MGRGYIAKKNAMKKTYMEPLKKYAEQLEKENYALKNDPDSLIGEFIGQYRELQSQNSRLSVLCAALISKSESISNGKFPMGLLYKPPKNTLFLMNYRIFQKIALLQLLNQNVQIHLALYPST